MLRNHLGGCRRLRFGRRARAYVAVGLLLPPAAAVVLGGAAVYRAQRSLPDVSLLGAYRPSETTEIWSADGVLLARLFAENRTVVSLSDIPQALKDATIATEDRRFFQHRGVDWRGAARALAANVRDGRYAQGGSTLTQQLVRNVYLSPEKRMGRKLREALLAIRAERRFTKPQILAMYLNQVYYGERSFGVEAAAQTYFGKHARDLSLAECALLAGLPRRPGLYDPYANPEAARRRRNDVLRQMVQAGVLDGRRAEAAMGQPVRLAGPRAPRLGVRRAPYFVDYVVQQLEDRYGAETVYRGGLRVQTTLNARVQDAAEEAVARRSGGLPRRAQVALVSIDPQTGYIRAMVGGRSYASSPFNRAVQARRQPGSAFKPFVYAAAVRAGAAPTDRITDAPITYADANWTPHNLGGRYHGRVTLTQALANSYNIPAVKLADQVGPGAVAALAHLCGITSELHETLSLALGTSEVSPLELASAYGVFAAGGIHSDPLSILTVKTARGGILESNATQQDLVLDGLTARRMDYMLRQVVRAGTGRAVAGVPGARGKTGTSDSHRDAWFVGYTPTLVAAVWVGYDRPAPIPGLTGGGACAPIWGAFMARARHLLPQRPEPEEPKPAPEPKMLVAEATSDGQEDAGAVQAADSGPTVAVRVCSDTGMLAGRYCPHTEVEAFPEGVQPTERCSLHGPPDANTVTVEVCAETGGLAGPDCPRVGTLSVPAGTPLPAPCTRHTGRATLAAVALGR